MKQGKEVSGRVWVEHFVDVILKDSSTKDMVFDQKKTDQSKHSGVQNMSGPGRGGNEGNLRLENVEKKQVLLEMNPPPASLSSLQIVFCG